MSVYVVWIRRRRWREYYCCFSMDEAVRYIQFETYHPVEYEVETRERP